MENSPPPQLMETTPPPQQATKLEALSTATIKSV